LAAAHIIARPHTEVEQILPVKPSDVGLPERM
ncbi:MAG: carbon dioxide-concentrating protein CcmK, partial [Nitrosomonadales bacterium]